MNDLPSDVDIYVRCETCCHCVLQICEYCFRCPDCAGALHESVEGDLECDECQRIAESVRLDEELQEILEPDYDEYYDGKDFDEPYMREDSSDNLTWMWYWDIDEVLREF